MAKIAKPEFKTLWAQEGNVTPPSLNQVLSGWQMNQFPPSNITNYQMNKVESAIAYIFQMGIPEWDKDIEYQINSLALHKTNGLVYRSKTVNTNKDPMTSGTDWAVAFDKFGASDDLRAELVKIMTQDGYIPYYVKISNPVMNGVARAPAFRAAVGQPSGTTGFQFENYNTTGVFCQGGDLLLSAGGVVNGRIKSIPPTLSMDDNTLVTTALLKKVIDEIKVATQLPVGMSIISNNKANPATYLGYGTWVQDVQGKALVGVKANAGTGDPDWVKYVDSTSGDAYTTTLDVRNLPSFRANILLNTWVGGDDASGEGAILTANRQWRSGTQLPDKSYADFQGENVPFSNVQPSQTKFIWTRTA
ncbi:putative tail fiber protein [Acinetobacter phage vB_AbaM_P1]|nr:putative tail fiber protein [Acinetobacter phage vB_AbaM_P1]